MLKIYDDGGQKEEGKEEACFPFQDMDEIKPSHMKRQKCMRCKRPSSVCICMYFPSTHLEIKTTIHILQHPREHNLRQLTTVPLLLECIPKDRCFVYCGKRFPEYKHSKLWEICTRANTICLYPSSDALDICDFISHSVVRTGVSTSDISLDNNIHMVVLDGTWNQAKQMYFNNKFLHHLTKIRLTGEWKSHYVIRTQPSNESLSTLEAIAIAIGQLEGKQDLINIVRRPLKALCDFQLKHGAVRHHTKEELLSLGIKYRVFNVPSSPTLQSQLEYWKSCGRVADMDKGEDDIHSCNANYDFMCNGDFT